ncbi:DUF6973 domain-containing protein [Aquimarina pacifica]|uniref:DUF6973 domain-containing protein n=1 Tax=Aquimarina pacifica TaxID=1296415 RepID=UPI0004B5DE0D|nr:hypothetical protein [Aquimarina pacifica]
MNFRKTCKPLFLVVSLALFVSCEKEIENNEVGDIETFENTIKVQYFKGIPVNHRFSASIEELESEDIEESLLNFYNTEKSKANKSLGVSEKEVASTLPDTDMIAESALEVYDEFPFQKNESENNMDSLLKEKLRQDQLIPEVREELLRLGYIEDVDALIEEAIAIADSEIEKSEQDNWEMIRSDFSTLSEEEIAKNIELINEYYLLNFEYVVLENIAYNEERIVNKIKETQLKNASQKALEGYDGPYYDKACTYAKVKLKGYTSAVHTVAMGTAALTAQSSSKEMFSEAEGGSSNTREDAYRHMLFNALLANYYPSVSSKVSSVNFAKAVGDSYEECGTNPLDSKEMDYHNNKIGRDVWVSKTSYRKVLWATVGLNRPSTSSLKSAIYTYVNEKSCFIVKTKSSAFPNNLLSRDQVPFEIWNRIRNTSDNIVVYFSGTIAPDVALPEGEYDDSECIANNLEPYTIIWVSPNNLIKIPISIPNSCLITSGPACYNID